MQQSEKLRTYTVGCQTIMPEGYEERHFVIQFYSPLPPLQNKAQDLIDFLNPLTAEIIDEITFVMDTEADLLVWSLDSYKKKLLTDLETGKLNF